MEFATAGGFVMPGDVFANNVLGRTNARYVRLDAAVREAPYAQAVLQNFVTQSVATKPAKGR